MNDSFYRVAGSKMTDAYGEIKWRLKEQDLLSHAPADFQEHLKDRLCLI